MDRILSRDLWMFIMGIKVVNIFNITIILIIYLIQATCNFHRSVYLID